MVFATGILLVGCITHERIRFFFRARASPSSSSSSSPPIVGTELEEVAASSALARASYDVQASSSSSSSGVVIGPRIDARGRPCGCATCTPPPPLSLLPQLPPPASADHIYVDMAGGDARAPFYVNMGGSDVAAPSSFTAPDAAVDPVVNDDCDVV